MALELVTIPCLTDNFAFLLHDAGSGETALIDAPEAGPVLAVLADRGWPLTKILLTHHHDDHIQAVPEIRAATGCLVEGATADAHRLPKLDRSLRPGDAVQVGAEVGVVIDVPGHTRGHIAFHFPDSALVFTADSLMAGGCGRLFEGTADEMHASLQRLAALPPHTRIGSGHDYLTGNLAFAATLEPGNRALTLRIEGLERMRHEGSLPMPSTLSDELATNPYLRADQPQIKAAVGLPSGSDLEVFTEIRARKDGF